MKLSLYMLEKMGYRRRATDELVTAEFVSVHVFSVKGISLSEDSLHQSYDSIAGSSYGMCMASSLNAASNALVAEDFCEDEIEFQTQHECSPPYLIVRVGPTKPHTITGDFICTDELPHSTYDGFPAAKSELQMLEKSILAPVLSSLTCAFAESGNPVSFRKVSREAFGTTTAGTRIVDISFSSRASLSVKRNMGKDNVSACFFRATALASSMSPKVSYFFDLAIGEPDPLKRFLYLFLTIERHTHSVFASVHHTAQFDAILRSPERVRVSADKLFNRQVERWTNLRDRFVWCAVSVWTQLTDADVDTFERVKKVRDQIAHGDLATPSAEDVAAVEALAIRIQLGP